VVTDAEDLIPFNKCWMEKYQGAAQVALKPKNTEQVSAILRYCNDKRIAVVPQGGNTGLVGGSVPVHDEIVLSTSLLNEIESFSAQDAVVVCGAGCILQSLDSHLAEKGFMVPLDLGAKGSCQIGGNVATNAGGLRLVRYGSLHGTVLGVEAVLADGTIVDNVSSLRKDNTGYHLHHLLIGSEGTLGVITKVAIATPRRPKSVQVAVLACQSFQDVVEGMQAARAQLSEIISAIEFLDRDCLDLVVAEPMYHLRDPLPDPYRFYLLIETSGSNAEHDQAKLEAFLESSMTEGLVQDGVVAQDGVQGGELWKLREKIPLALQTQGKVFKYDLSMATESMYELVETMRSRLRPRYPDAKVFGYGHLGDGNLHLNITAPADTDPAILDEIEPFVYEWTAERKGSVSAEHGIGVMKTGAIHLSKSGEMLALMRKIKEIYDPNAILNPYKMLPPSSAA